MSILLVDPNLCIPKALVYRVWGTLEDEKRLVSLVVHPSNIQVLLNKTNHHKIEVLVNAYNLFKNIIPKRFLISPITFRNWHKCWIKHRTMLQLFLLLNNLSPLFKHFVITDPWSLSRYEIVTFFFKWQLHLVKRPNMKIQKCQNET